MNQLNALSNRVEYDALSQSIRTENGQSSGLPAGNDSAVRRQRYAGSGRGHVQFPLRDAVAGGRDDDRGLHDGNRHDQSRFAIPVSEGHGLSPRTNVAGSASAARDAPLATPEQYVTLILRWITI
jgi:hypothetical protein